MKLYCFLLLIILIFLVYDNKLYEGNDHTYDTSQDNIMAYGKNSEDTESGWLYSTGELVAIMENPTTLISGGDTSVKDYKGDPISCDRFTSVNDCSNGIRPHMFGNSWKYGNTDDGIQTKKNCMDCFTCNTQGVLPHAFYARMCDSLAGCYADPNSYKIEDTLPYVYAFNQNDVWENTPIEITKNGEKTNYQIGCGDDGDDGNKNPLQNISCKGYEYGETLIDMMLLTKKPESMECHAKIAVLESGLVGDLVGGLSNSIL